MGNGSHPSDRKLKAAEQQSNADRTGRNKQAARNAQSEADHLDMKKH
ncbi:MAG: hypothetical protein K0R57_6558 [Paenibacillaceae bacterium]|jgi:hypothetical protein|nr:hypothetical protein [Paenibacillaceae bacterium]